HAGDPGDDRGRGGPAWPRHAAAPERRRPRRADDGAPRPDGHDLRAQRGRDQPLAEGALAVGGRRPRRGRAARDGARPRGLIPVPTARPRRLGPQADRVPLLFMVSLKKPLLPPSVNERSPSWKRAFTVLACMTVGLQGMKVFEWLIGVFW